MKTIYYVLQYQITDGPHNGKWTDLSFWDNYNYVTHQGETPHKLFEDIVGCNDNFYNYDSTSDEFFEAIKDYKLVEVHVNIETLEVPLDDYRSILT